MARREVPKEDLVRDATAYATRVELRKKADDPDWIFVGLRNDGGGSVYFGDEEFYAFNPQGELRRAFANGRLYKAESGRLIAMRRERTEDESVLASEDLPPDEQDALIQSLTERIAQLVNGLEDRSISVSRSAGEATIDQALIRDWLSQRAKGPIIVAQRPHAGG